MTADEIKFVRNALGRALGRRISQRDLGVALGLASANAGDTVRSWEDGSRDITGPASVTLRLMVHCCKIGQTEIIDGLFHDRTVTAAASKLSDASS